MKFKSKLILGIVTILFSQGITAQIYVGVQSGAASIKSDVQGTVAKSKFGGAVKVGYVYSLTKNIGIGTGLEFSQYQQEVALANSSSTLNTNEVDLSTSAFVYNVETRNYNEKQTLRALQIPLFVEYKTNINKGIDFNFRAGAKYFLPLSYKIKATADYVKGSAYYPDFNLNIDDLPEYGLGSQSNYAASGEYQTKAIVMSMFELGFTIDMGTKNALYAAMFLENGYGSILDQGKEESYIGYNPSSVADRKANGLYSTDKNAKVKTFAFGLTLGWNFK